MGKVETYTKNRIEGLAWALRIIERENNIESGVEMLRREIRFRNIVRIPLEIPPAQIRDANVMLTRRLLNAVLVVVLKVLEDEYGWKKQRLQSFIKKFANHTIGFEDIDPYGDKYAELSHYAEYFRETYGIEFTDEAIEEMETVEQENRSREIRRVQMDSIEKILKNSYPEALEHLKKALGIKTADVAEKDTDGQMTLMDYPVVVPEGVLNDGKA